MTKLNNYINKKKSALDNIFLQNRMENDRYNHLDPYYAMMLSKELSNLISCI